MNRLQPIALDADWQCEYFELNPGIYEFMNAIAVPSLAAWSFDRVRVSNWAAYLRRSFWLAPTASCISYFLYIDSAPAHTRIFINDHPSGDYVSPGPDDPPFEMDITLYVALGENEIGFRVAWDAPGHFIGVRLQPVLCG
jgi:hypothetical protein